MRAVFFTCSSKSPVSASRQNALRGTTGDFRRIGAVVPERSAAPISSLPVPLPSEPGRQRLSDGHQIRPHAQLLEIERVACTAKSALHFIRDQQCACLRAHVVDRVGEFLREGPDATFALNRPRMTAAVL